MWNMLKIWNMKNVEYIQSEQKKNVIINFDHISHLFLLFLLLTLNKWELFLLLTWTSGLSL